MKKLITVGLLSLFVSYSHADEYPAGVPPLDKDLARKIQYTGCTNYENADVCMPAENYANQMQAKRPSKSTNKPYVIDVHAVGRMIMITEWHPEKRETFEKAAADMKVSMQFFTNTLVTKNKHDFCTDGGNIKKWVNSGIWVQINFLYNDNSLMSSTFIDSCDEFMTESELAKLNKERTKVFGE